MADIRKFFNIWLLSKNTGIKYMALRDFMNGNWRAITAEEIQIAIDAINSTSKSMCIELEDMKDKRMRHDKEVGGLLEAD